MKKRLFLLLTLAVMAVSAVACGGDEEPVEDVVVEFEDEAEVDESVVEEPEVAEEVADISGAIEEELVACSGEYKYSGRS